MRFGRGVGMATRETLNKSAFLAGGSEPGKGA
jgi:hypothetical protein